MRKFEKISFNQYWNDTKNSDYLYKNMEETHNKLQLREYKNIKLPQRATQNSAGYDFYSPVDFTLKTQEEINIKSGIRVFMNPDELLMMFVRSSYGFKYQVNLVNGTGIIDADYVNADNEGHINIKLVNRGNKDLVVHKGDAIAQGIFTKYYFTDDDVPVTEKRTGGIGSTSQ